MFVLVQQLRALVPSVRKISGSREASVLLQKAGETMGLPWVYWFPNFSTAERPGQREFHLEAGFPEAFLNDFVERGYHRKTLLGVRCRVEHLPFAVAMSELHNSVNDLDRDDRAMASQWLELGLETLVVVPLHLPRSQVGLLGWGGRSPIARARDLVVAAGPELMALGHEFARRMEACREVTDSPEDLQRLTSREHEFLRLIASGSHISFIAKQAGISPTTVRFHLDNARKKLGADSQSHLVALAVQLGLLGPISRGQRSGDIE